MPRKSMGFTLICAAAFWVVTCVGQSVYRIPFASTDNIIELTLANTSHSVLSGVTIAVSDVPAWLQFKGREQNLGLLKVGQELTTRFSFSIDKTAPVNKNHKVSFTVTNSNAERWHKEIDITVAPPDRFLLFQNYPNPFNPSTTISYQLPSDGRVALKIYNVLGQLVSFPFDNEQSAGYHQTVFDATGFSTGMSTKGGYASGVYVYQISYTDDRGERQFSHKRMLLLK